MPKTAEQLKFEEQLRRILITEEVRKAVGHDWLVEYKEELDGFLFAQYKKTRQQVIEEIANFIESNINEVVGLLAGYDEETRRQYHIDFDGFGKLLASWVRQAKLKE